jgi:hypothetical protein
VPDDHHERTPGFSKPLEAPFHQLAADALSLIRRQNCHRPEPRTDHGPHRQRAEHDVAHDSAVGNRDQGQEGGIVRTEGVDDLAFLLLMEGLSIDLANSIDVARLLVSDFKHWL